MTITKKIDILMKKHNVKNLHQLAIATNIPYTTLRSINETSEIKVSTAKKLCNFFDITFDELLNDDINL